MVIMMVALANQGGPAKSSNAVYAPLWLYQGSWQVTRKSLAAGAKPDQLVNQCALLGKYFACQQTVNGADGGLVIFIPAEKAGQYYTQNITKEGRAGGKGDLDISGDHWTYSSRWPEENGKITYYRTTNLFTGKNRIHFEQAESPDGKQWTVTGSGDEVRTGGATK